MNNFNCKSARHLGMWLPQQPVSAFAGTINPSIRSYNDEGLPGSFIEGAGYA
jgi:hypothetical protein